MSPVDSRRCSVHTFLFVLDEYYVLRRSSRWPSFTGLGWHRNNARIPEYLKLFFTETRIIVLVFMHVICAVWREEVSERLQLIFKLFNFLCHSGVSTDVRVRRTQDAHL